MKPDVFVGKVYGELYGAELEEDRELITLIHRWVFVKTGDTVENVLENGNTTVCAGVDAKKGGN